LSSFATSHEKIYCNAQMSSRHIRTFCDLSACCERLLERSITQQGLSARAHDRILKVARTSADIEHAPNTDRRSHPIPLARPHLLDLELALAFIASVVSAK
jgi:predicted ATPase with chaperone activity